MSRKNIPFTRITILLSLITLLLGACAAAKAPTSVSESQRAVAPSLGAPAEAPAAPQAISGGSYSSDSAQNSAQAAERLVIKNANLTIVVDDPSKSMDNISRLAEDMGGFVVNADLTYSETEGGVQIPHAAVTIRVPAERLDEAMGRIQSESQRAPLDKKINSQDVTKDYTDLQSRLRNLEAAEKQLTEIMGSATKTEDVLNVYNQLTQVRGEIEVTKGQINYYEQSAALSSISVDILANAAVQPLTIGSWQPGGVAKTAVQALITGVKFLANAGIWLLLFFVPMAILILLPIMLVVWIIRKLLAARRRAKMPLPPAQPAA